MISFIISQVVGVTLFATLNYGFYCYIRYRRDQFIGKSKNNDAKSVYNFYMTGLLVLALVGLFYKYAYIRKALNLDDYYYQIINYLFIDTLHTLPADIIYIV